MSSRTGGAAFARAVCALGIMVLGACTTYDYRVHTQYDPALERQVTVRSECAALGEYDTDGDGLFNDREERHGTDPTVADTDGDGISDYLEITKYRTDPLSRDSDGDGIPDSDSEERREYTYTIRAICRIVPPYDVQTMTDQFQDVVALDESWSGLVYQITYYPESKHIVESLPLRVTRSVAACLPAGYTDPGPIINFDDAMRADCEELFVSGENDTDLDVLDRVFAWERTEVDTPRPGAPYPEPFLDLRISPEGDVRLPERPFYGVGEGKLGDPQWQLTHLVLGKEAFYNRTHGSCGSTSTFLATILRSLGIPTRIIQTVPLANFHSPSERSMLSEIDDPNVRDLLARGRTSCNHFVCEAYVGGRWLRIDPGHIYESVRANNAGGSFVKTSAYDSWRKADFAATWREFTWEPGSPRPYRLLAVEDQEAVHR